MYPVLCQGKKGKGAKNEGDGDKDIGEVGDAGAGGEEDRPKKPLSKKERRRLDEEERRQRELAEIEVRFSFKLLFGKRCSL